jgi:hypothetical protein
MIWEIGLRLFERSRQSLFKPVLMKPLADWLRRQWTQILEEERFRLWQPRTTVPDIEIALAAETGDAPFIAGLLRAAAPAVQALLSSEYRELLGSLAVE